MKTQRPSRRSPWFKSFVPGPELRAVAIRRSRFLHRLPLDGSRRSELELQDDGGG